MGQDYTLGEVMRAFIDFRQETRDELKWLRRLLIGTLTSAILASLVSSTLAVLTR